MCSRAIASLFSLCFLTLGAEALQSDSALTIEYPIENYRVVENDPDTEVRSQQVLALRKRLSAALSVALVAEEAGAGGPSVATNLRLERAVPPIRILVNDPRYLYRSPVILEWQELVDERGKVTRIWVTASNQSKRDDRRILEWCAGDALNRPNDIGAGSISMLRGAGVTLVTSGLHYSYWVRKLSTTGGAIAGLVFLAIFFWLVARVSGFRRRRRHQHEQMMSRLHRATPYRPPSIDDE